MSVRSCRSCCVEALQALGAQFKQLVVHAVEQLRRARSHFQQHRLGRRGMREPEVPTELTALPPDFDPNGVAHRVLADVPIGTS
jgi:hypothetical protein